MHLPYLFVQITFIKYNSVKNGVGQYPKAKNGQKILRICRTEGNISQRIKEKLERGYHTIIGLTVRLIGLNLR